jgi:toxin ParE1/3/4
MNKYVLSNLAKEDLIGVYKYGCLQFGELQAEKYYLSFFDFFELLCKNPHLYESVDYVRARL